jgi:ABC-2 type transport system permease protein
MQTLNPPAPRFRWLEKYYKAFELGFQFALEYRINFLISLISAAYPIFIQSFLWSAIFQSSD